MDDGARRHNLAKHAKKWRQKAGNPSLKAIWDNGGPSPATVTRIENAGAPDPEYGTLQKLDDVYGLEDGTAARALAGEDLPDMPVRFGAAELKQYGRLSSGAVPVPDPEAKEQRGIVESLAEIAIKLPLTAEEHRQVEELLKEAQIREMTLRAHEHIPEISTQLIKQNRADVAALAAMVRRMSDDLRPRGVGSDGEGNQGNK